MRLEWPLIGRNAEMRMIDAAIEAPGISGILICGAAGVGKSRIAREALDSAASNGRDVRWAVGTSSANSLPLGAFASWAEWNVKDPLQLVRGVVETLTSSSKGTAVIVGVDDVHLLDDMSTFVLYQIVHRSAAKVLLTVRDGEPISAATQEVWKGGTFDRLDLQALSLDETAMLLSATLDGAVDPDSARRLWQLTRGNVLYLQNIVEQEIADQRLLERNGFWRWSGDPVVPPGLVDLITSRIGAVPAPVSDVIDALAVGEPIELALLTRITDPAAIEEADVRGLITLEDVDGKIDVRLAHPLYGEVRRKRVAPTRLRRLRGLVAAELASGEDRDDIQIVVRRATLSLDSDLEPDAELLTSAAYRAVWQVDLPLADRLADAAIRAGGGAEARFVRAFLLSWQGDGQRADAVLADVPAGLSDGENSRLAFLGAVNRLFSLADPAAAKRLIDDAAQSIPPHARDCIDAARTIYWAAMGKPKPAREAYQRITAEQLPDGAARMTAWAITVALGEAGRPTEAVVAAEAGYSMAFRGFLVVTDAHASALMLSGRVADAHDVAETLRQRASDYPSPQLSPVGTALAGRAALAAGRLDTACSLLGPAVELLTASSAAVGLSYRYRLPHATALAMRGFIDDASAAFIALMTHRHPGWQHLDYELGIAQAWVSACQGAVGEAIEIALSAAQTASRNGQFAAEVMCLQTAAQFGDGSSHPRLRALEAIVEGPRAGIASRFAAALKGGEAAELRAVSDDFEQMGDLVAAADAAAHAAAEFRRQGLRGSALGCVARAQALAKACGGAVTPALRQATERVPLTSREREIVMLLAAGLSNRDVAKRLTLSVRTVEGHIYRAMARTGTASRDELINLLPAMNT